MNRWIIILVLVGISAVSHAQINAGDDISVCFGEQVNLHAEVGIPNNYHQIYFEGEDKVYYEVLSVGFTFMFYGNQYTRFVVGSNGWISFDTTLAGTVDPWRVKSIPSTEPEVPKNAIMAPWQDWSPYVYEKAYVGYETIGDAPFRRLVVSWFNVPLRQKESSLDSLGVFQVILNEWGNTIEYHITKKPDSNWPSDDPGKATLGIHNLLGNEATAVPGKNFTQWISIEDAWKLTPANYPVYNVSQIDFEPEIIGSLSDVLWYRNKYDPEHPEDSLVAIGPDHIFTPAYSADYIAVIILNEAVPYKDTVRVTVNPIPYVNAGPDQEILIGTQAQLEGSGSAGTGNHYFAWEPASMVVDPSDPNTMTQILTLPQLYQLAVQDDLGCRSDTDEVVITIINGPLFANLEVNKTKVCSGDTVRLEASAWGGQITDPYTYLWTAIPPQGGFIPDPSDSVVYAAPQVTTKYYVEVRDILNDSWSDSITVTVPVVDPEIIEGDTSVCAFDNGIIYLVDDTENIIEWSIQGLVAQNTSANNTTEFTVDWGEAGSGYIVVLETTNDLLQCSDTTFIPVDVHPNPEPLIISDFDSICQGEIDIPYYTAYNAGHTYEWSLIPDTAGEIQNDTVDHILVDWRSSGSHWIYVKEISSFGCSESYSKQILVNPLPEPMIIGMPSVCRNDTFPYLSGYYAGNRYEWDLQPPGIGQIVSPVDSSEIKILWQQSGNAYLTLKETVESTLCVNVADTFFIQINPIPILKTIPEEDAVCEGDSAIVMLSGADSYYWMPWEGLTNITDSSWIVKPDKSMSYKIVGTNESTGCYDSTFYSLSIKLNPVIELGEPRFLYPGEPVIVNAGPDYDSYNWSDGSIESELVTYSAGDYWVVVEKNGCYATDTVQVTLPLQSLPIPNAFTPNGDGFNDKFNVVAIYGNVNYYQMDIYNRWGEKVFETSKIDEGWDGTCNGELCPPGVYRWIISFEETDAPVSGSVNKTGSVTLLR